MADRSVLVPELTRPPKRAARDARLVRVGGETMGTVWSVTAYLPEEGSRDALSAACRAVLSDVIGAMSTWHDQSAICRWNTALPGEPVSIPPSLVTVLSAALSLARLTDGVFDPSLLGRTAAAGFAPPGTPADQRRGGWRDVVLDEAAGTAARPPGVRLDLSAIAKGYAVDRIADAAERLGASAVLAEIGGEFAGRGLKPDLTPWWVEAEGGAFRAALPDAALATSGHAARSYERGSRRVSHVEAPADGLQSVSVVASDCMSADGWATALLAAGRDRGLRLAAEHGVAALFGTATSEAVLSPAAKRMAEG